MHSSAHVSSRARATSHTGEAGRRPDSQINLSDPVTRKASQSCPSPARVRSPTSINARCWRTHVHVHGTAFAASWPCPCWLDLRATMRSPGQRGGRGPRTPCVAYSALFSQGQIVNVRTVHTYPQTEQILPVPACCWMHYIYNSAPSFSAHLCSAFIINMFMFV